MGLSEKNNVKLTPLAGTDLILDGQGNDVAVFNGVSLSQITLSHTSGGLNLQYSSTDTVSIADGLLGGIKTYQFADGTLSWHELANRYLDTSVYANYGTPIHGLAGGRQNDTVPVVVTRDLQKYLVCNESNWEVAA